MEKAMIDKMVDRFLGWKLPKDFSPDAGISFGPTKPDGYDEPGGWPIGTNLLPADQARAMIEHILHQLICPFCGSADIDHLHSAGGFSLPECYYWECSTCREQWGHV